MIDIKTGKEIENPAILKVPLAGSANATVGGMMRNVGARNATMFGETLPYDEELIWINSLSGLGAYIDTGINVKLDDLYVECVQESLTYRLFDSTFGANPYVVFTSGGGLLRYRYNSQQYDIASPSVGVVYSRKFINNVAFLDDTEVARFTISSLTVPYTSLVCARSTSASSYEETSSYYGVHKLTLISNGKSVNLIPVLKDGFAAMYDTVSKSIFYNKANGRTFGYKKKDGTIVYPTQRRLRQRRHAKTTGEEKQ